MSPVLQLLLFATLHAPAAQPAAVEPAPAEPEPEPEPELELEPEPEDPARPEREPTAAELEAAPDPTKADGVAQGNASNRKKVLWLPRVVLFAPKVALQMVQMPVRGLAYLYDRFQLPERVSDVVLMDERRAGILPVASFATGLRGRIGARFFHHNLMGHGERVSARATFAFAGEQQHRLHLTTGRLLPRGFELDLVVQFWLLKNTRFFGIGNGDLQDAPDVIPDSLINPLQDNTAIATRFRETAQTYTFGFKWRFHPLLTWKLISGIDLRRFTRQVRGALGDADTLVIYDPEGLVGLAGGLLASYSLTELMFSTLRTTRPWITAATPSTGWRVTTTVAYTKGIDERDPSNFVDWMVDVQRLFDVYRGDRVIALRVHAQGVTGPLSRVPVVRLPQLGGTHLRGYPNFRFQDRIATFGAVEYRYPIGEAASGYFFFDFGRVYRSAADIELRKWRAGGGPGIILHTRTDFIARVFVAASVDGSFFFRFSLDPLTR